MRVMVADLEGRLLSNPAAQRILDRGTGVPIKPERTTVFGWCLSDQVTVVPAERFPRLRASHGEEFTDSCFSSASWSTGNCSPSASCSPSLPEREEFGARVALDYIVAHHNESARQIADGLHLAARRFAVQEPQP